jgi:hypothetical protein
MRELHGVFLLDKQPMEFARALSLPGLVSRIAPLESVLNV